MKNYELKDKVIILLNTIITEQKEKKANTEHFTVNINDIIKKTNNTVDQSKLTAALEEIIDDGLIKVTTRISRGGYYFRVNSSFYDAIENTQGKYSTEYKINQLQLTSLENQIHLTKLEIVKLEKNGINVDSILSKLGNISTIVTTIKSVL